MWAVGFVEVSGGLVAAAASKDPHITKAKLLYINAKNPTYWLGVFL